MIRAARRSQEAAGAMMRGQGRRHMQVDELKANVTVYGPLFPEPVQVIIAVPMGTGVKLVGKGAKSNTVYEPVLSADQLALLTASPASMRLGLAYEYDPYFSLSIARVDRLPHQLEVNSGSTFSHRARLAIALSDLAASLPDRRRPDLSSWRRSIVVLS